MKKTGNKSEKWDVGNVLDKFSGGETEAPRRKGRRAVFVAPLIVAAVLIIAVAAGAALTAARDTVYPNVFFGDVELSGMTVQEAESALRAAGYETGAENVRADLVFPDDTTVSVTADDAGLKLSAAAAAERAFNYGRGGNFFAREFALLKSYTSSTVFEGEFYAPIDEPRLRGIANDATAAFNNRLQDDAYTVNPENLEIIKGSRTAQADANDIYTLLVSTLYNSLDVKAPQTARYELPPVSGDERAIDLRAIYDAVTIEPAPAQYDYESNEITDGVTGVSFDLDAAQTAVDRADMGEKIVIPLIFTPPEVTREVLETTLFRDIIAERTTYISGTSNRLTNITLAAAAINGTILNPGDTFSYNDIVGKRTSDKGYKLAGAYSGGTTVQEIGGGICQVSSTIYDCVLHTDLEVVERRNHSFTVSYLPLGNDATINWGTTDFKFKNNTEYPIRIDTSVVDRNLTIQLFGTKTLEGRIEIKYETISTTGYRTVEVEDETVAPGQNVVTADGHTGYVVDTYKYYYDDAGTFLRKEYIARSTYNASNKVVHVPVFSVPTDDPSIPVDGPGDEPDDPMTDPSEVPSTPEPTYEPSAEPTTEPTAEPTGEPTAEPTYEPEPTPPFDVDTTPDVPEPDGDINEV